MKKIIIVLLSTLLLFCACSNQKEQKNKETEEITPELKEHLWDIVNNANIEETTIIDLSNLNYNNETKELTINYNWILPQSNPTRGLLFLVYQGDEVIKLSDDNAYVILNSEYNDIFYKNQEDPSLNLEYPDVPLSGVGTITIPTNNSKQNILINCVLIDNENKSGAYPIYEYTIEFENDIPYLKD